MTKTLAELRTLVLEPVDMQAEDFVDTAEVNRYINQGIKQAEAEIHCIYQDYFLARETISLQAGVRAYSLPSSIYAHKIRHMSYQTPEKKYVIQRIRSLDDILYIDENENYYSYLVVNQAGSDPKIEIYPTPKVNETNAITIWYLREATQLVNDTDTINIPEFYNFVVLYARQECLKKELGNPILTFNKEELEQERQNMITTLQNRHVDNNTELLPDLDHYLYFDSDWWGLY